MHQGGIDAEEGRALKGSEATMVLLVPEWMNRLNRNHYSGCVYSVKGGFSPMWRAVLAEECLAGVGPHTGSIKNQAGMTA